MINNEISMTIQSMPWRPPTSAVLAASLFLQRPEFKCGMQQQPTVMYLNKHACRPCMYFEIKLETTSSQKTSCQTHKNCVSNS